MSQPRYCWSGLIVLAMGCTPALQPNPSPTHRPASTPSQRPSPQAKRPSALENPSLNAQGHTEYLHRKDGMSYVVIAAGSVEMGSHAPPPPGLNPQLTVAPRQLVQVRRFAIATSEINIRQMRVFLRATGKHSDYLDRLRGKDQVQPALGAPLEVYLDYCKWAGARVPSEAEWELAAHGPRPQAFPYGPAFRIDLSPLNLPGPERVASHPAGASPYGCCDMAGSAWEICRGAGGYVLRGGSYRSRHPGEFMTVVRQPLADPQHPPEDVGLRPVFEKPPESNS